MRNGHIDARVAAAYLLSGPMGANRFDASQPLPKTVESAINILIGYTRSEQGSPDALHLAAPPILVARMAGLRHPVLTAIVYGENYDVLAIEDVSWDSEAPMNLHEDLARRCQSHRAEGVILGRNFISDSILHLQALPFVVRKMRRTLKCLEMTLQDVILVRAGAAPWSMLPDGPDCDPVLPGFIRNWRLARE